MADPETSSDDDARAEAERTQRRQFASNMRALIRPHLVDAGVLTVAATYTGHDSGAVIRSVTLGPEDAIDLDGITLVMNGDVLALPLLAGTVTYSLRRTLEEMFMALVAIDVPGLDVTERSEGTVLWDIASDQIAIKHIPLSPCGVVDTQEH